MIVTKEINLQDFVFWSGAIYVRHYVEELGLLDDLQNIIEQEYPEGIDETELNDLFWHEGDTIARWLGYENEEDMRKACERLEQEED